MRVPEHKIQEVLERIDLVTLISRHVELKKAGRSFKGRCPFHQEKSASFHVTPEMRRYKCFGCQAGGDAISFLQRYFGKTFMDALKDLAQEAGVDLEASIDPSARERQYLKDVTDFAAEHFKTQLWKPDKGLIARNYLESRGVTEATARAFGLGWAPLAWSELADALIGRGWSTWGVKAGLISERPKGDGFYDLFRGRLIIPIRSPEGRTIAFGGRMLEGETGPKYLNSRESKLYNKSDTLFGMDMARESIRKKKSAVLVEGYFDCIGLHQVGIQHAVALCSTALTPGHLQALARAEAQNLILLLDGDDAGRKAVERLAGTLLASGTSVRVALLPEGDDPDTYARKVGLDVVTQLLEQAPPLSEHLLKSVLPRGKEANFEEKMQGIGRLRPVFAHLPLGLTRSAFVAATATHFGVPSSELEREVQGKTAPPTPVAPAKLEPTQAPAKPERPVDPLEVMFAALALKDSNLLSRDTYRLADELLSTGLRNVLAQASAGVASSEILFETPLPLRKSVEDALRQLPATQEDMLQTFQWTCRKLKLKRIEEQLGHIARLTAKLAGALDLTEETRRLLAERSELLQLKRRILEDKP